jgi:hypothetical protein
MGFRWSIATHQENPTPEEMQRRQEALMGEGADRVVQRDWSRYIAETGSRADRLLL